MDGHSVARARLANLGLTSAPGGAGTATDLVRRLGAVQSQDYGPALWSLGARMGVPLAAAERDVLDGHVVRTHVLRPTWHFVPAEDLLWMLELTAPRVEAFNAYYYRRNGLDEEALAFSRRLIEATLGDGEQTRPQLAEALARAGVDVVGLRFALILMNAELTGVICSGVPQGKQQTYALVAERIPHSRELTGDEALAELTCRYFTSHGPASVKDFAWWSSLRRPQILRGIELAGDRLRRDDVDGVLLWGPPEGPDDAGPAGQVAHLVQAYDEYIVGYTQTKGFLDLAGLTRMRPAGVTIRNHVLLVGGQVAGHWKRTVSRKAVVIELTLDRPLTPAEHEAVEHEAAAHGRFLGLEAELAITPG